MLFVLIPLVFFFSGVCLFGCFFGSCSKEKIHIVSGAVSSCPKQTFLKMMFQPNECSLDHSSMLESSVFLSGKLFKIPIVIKRGPCIIPTITNEKGEDLYSVLSPYLGPNNNFFGISILTPKMLGYSSLLINGKLFQENDVLCY